MKKGLGLVGTAMTGAAVLFLFASSAAGAASVAPPYFKQAPAPGPVAAPPSTIALLGAGLVALGVYARRKNNKKK
jgi:hypothetical protein